MNTVHAACHGLKRRLVQRLKTRKSLTYPCLILVLVFAIAAPLAGQGFRNPRPPAYPVKASPNKRYLVDQNNIPFLLNADGAHALIANVSVQDAATYFANRAAHGINAVWVELLCNTYTRGRADGSTYDGIIPFTTPGDMATPNETYFARVDDMVNLAASYGITVLMDTFETGGWMSMLEENGPTKAFNYGVYLGNRYRDFKNIIWITGNDFQSWYFNSTDNQDIAAIMSGVASADSNHLQTTELNYLVSGSLDDSLLVPYTTLAGVYTFYPTYAEVLAEYNVSSQAPVFMEEANYEYENNTSMDYGDPPTLRRQEYWTMLSGASGQGYGNGGVWGFLDGWQSALDSPGIEQLQYLYNLFTSRQWWKLVPDQNHSVVIAGYGTFATTGSIHENDYVTAAGNPDGSLVIAYCPVSTTITVDMTKMKGLTRAVWFDPSNGTSTAIKPALPNTGTHQFTTPGVNADGNQDWVLILEATNISR